MEGSWYFNQSVPRRTSSFPRLVINIWTHLVCILPFQSWTMRFASRPRLMRPALLIIDTLEVALSADDERATSLSAEAPVFAPSSQVDRLVHGTFAALARYSIDGQPHLARLGATHSLMRAVPRHLMQKCSRQQTDAVIYRHLFSSTSWFA